MNVSQKGCSVMNGIENSAMDFKKRIISMDKCWFTALDSLEQSLLAMRDELFNSYRKRDLSITGQILIEETAGRAARLMQAAADQHREMQSAIIKIGKHVHYYMERNIRDPFEYSPDLERDEDRKAVGFSLIHDYVMSSGYETVAILMKELAEFEDMAEPFRVNHPCMFDEVVYDLRKGRIWSSLECLKCVEPEQKIIRTLQTQIITESILELVLGMRRCKETVSKMQTFRVHCPEDEHQLQRLVGALLLGTDAKEDSRYSKLFSSLDRENLITKMLSYFMPREIPLMSLMRHGFKGFQGMAQMLSSSYHWDVWQDWELPFDTYPTGRHSAFSCPILKEQCSVRNPPTRLNCGHVISKDACARLTANRNRTLPRHSRQYRFKCPYCPKENSMDITRTVDLRTASDTFYEFSFTEEDEQIEEKKEEEKEEEEVVVIEEIKCEKLSD